ncbi:hypothetical protein MMC14_002592 [Varicellaria rhodocarpa]|nr:hypothetical protein [Varicellaria rhodocarpa]
MVTKIDPVHKRGQKLYREMDWEGAIKCFTRVIKKCNPPPLTAYDNRAAAHIKMGNLSAALGDGKVMIQMAKKSATGYLRTSQVLQLMDKEEMALGIYKYGLLNVLTDDANFKLVRDMYDKLNMKLIPPSRVDPLRVLPVELVEMVISYLNFHHLLTLLRVSKAWSQLLTAIPRLWRHLDLSKAKKDVNRKSLISSIKRFNGAITHATLYRCGQFSESDLLPLIVNNCKNLECLEILDGPANALWLKAAPLASRLTTFISGVDHETALDVVTQILAEIPSLTRAEFHMVYSSGDLIKWSRDLSRLRVLKIHTKRSLRTRNCGLNHEELFSKIPQIHELSLPGWRPSDRSSFLDISSLTHLSSLNLSGLVQTDFPRLPPSLRILDMTDCNTLEFDLAITEINLATFPLPNLISVTLPFARNISLAVIHLLFEPNKGKLTKLDIGGATFNIDVSELITAGYLAEVTELRLRNRLVNDTVAKKLALNLPKLKILDVSLTEITGVGVKALCLKKGARLEKLNLDHCEKVSVDAVEWARKRGVEVQYNLWYEGGGSKVRHL